MGEIPHLRAAVSRLKETPFEILSVSLDDESSAPKRLIKAMRFPGNHTWHEKGWGNPAAEKYNVQALSTQYLIDPNGVIQARNPDPKELPHLVMALSKKAKRKG